MTKSEMALTLRCVGCNENTITAMENAFDMGMEHERELCATLCESTEGAEGKDLAKAIRARGEA